MAKFDGRTGISVPESLLPSATFPAHKFTIATWMRHRENKAQDKHTKEHIICKADDHRKCIYSDDYAKNRNAKTSNATNEMWH